MLNPSHAFVLGLIMSIVGSIGMLVDKKFVESVAWTWLYFLLTIIGGLTGFVAGVKLVVLNW